MVGGSKPQDWLRITLRLREVPKPLWNEDFSGNPEKSEVTSWAEEFGKIGEFAWQISVSDPIFLLIAVKSFSPTQVWENCVRRVGKESVHSNERSDTSRTRIKGDMS